jgi:hypothetical protein
MDKPDEQSLEFMRISGGTWATYQNVALDHSQLGHLKFLKYGKGCTFESPPKPRLPDGPDGAINWAYQFRGLVNLETGEIDVVS